MSYCDLITAVKLLSNMIAIRRFGTAGIQYRSWGHTYISDIFRLHPPIFRPPDVSREGLKFYQ